MRKESTGFTPYVPDYKSGGKQTSVDVHHREVLQKIREREDLPTLNDETPPAPLSKKGELSDMQWGEK